MIVLELILWLFLIYVSYFQIVYILFKGKQYNRFFATFINTIIPVIGSVPTFIMACKYEKRIGGFASKLDDKTLKYIQVSLQALSVIFLFLPIFSVSSGSISGMNLIFGKATHTDVVRPTLILIYMVVLPVLSAVLNFFYTKNNISNFITYSASLVNILSLQVLNFVISSNGAAPTVFFWLYSILNTAIMLVSIFLMVIRRDKFLYKLEYKEKIEYIKEQQEKEQKKAQNASEQRTYKCAKCGKSVVKGTICSCIEKRSPSTAEASANGENLPPPPDSYCVYCKKPLAEGESCNCQGEGFGITVKNESPKNRKCMYCGQLLVGESTCVCEKIMKNSNPVENQGGKKEEPKRYFESQVEKSSNLVAGEFDELQKKINSRFEQVKENLDLSPASKSEE